jgi:hypothetical protein
MRKVKLADLRRLQVSWFCHLIRERMKAVSPEELKIYNALNWLLLEFVLLTSQAMFSLPQLLCTADKFFCAFATETSLNMAISLTIFLSLRVSQL